MSQQEAGIQQKDLSPSKHASIAKEMALGTRRSKANVLQNQESSCGYTGSDGETNFLLLSLEVKLRTCGL